MRPIRGKPLRVPNSKRVSNGSQKKGSKSSREKGQEDVARGKEVSVRSSDDEAQILYGRMKIGGNYTFIETSQESAAYLITGDSGSNNQLVFSFRTAGGAGDSLSIYLRAIGANTATTVANVYGDRLEVILRTNGSNASLATLNEVIAAVQANGTAWGLYNVQKLVSGTNGIVQPIAQTNLSYGGGTWLHQVITLTGCEIDEIESLYLDNRLVTFGASPDPRWGTGVWANKVFMAKMLGSDSQEACPDLITQLPSKWTTNHRQRGFAGIYLITVQDTTLFPQGEPKVSVIARGKKFYDPRSGSTVYSANCALAIGDLLTNTRYGYGIPTSRIDTATWQAAANACDEQVQKADLSYENRYEANGIFDVGQRDETLRQLEQAMAGKVVESGGIYYILPGVYRSPSFTFTQEDLRGDISLETHVSISDVCNTVRGTYAAPASDWNVTDFPPVKNSTYITEDGKEYVLDLVLNFVTSPSQCQRIAKIEMERSRQGQIIEWPGKISCYQARIGDTVTIVYPRWGINKVYEVEDGNYVCEEDGAMGTDLVLRETASGIYSWNNGEETTVDLAPNTNLPDPTVVNAPTGLTLTTGSATLYLRSDGTVAPRIKVSWTLSTTIFVDKYEIQFKTNASSEWSPSFDVRKETNIQYLADVKSGEYYDVRIRALNSLDYKSSWVTVTNFLCVGKEAKPSDVTGFVATKNDFGISFVWNAIADLDADQYEIRVGASWAAGTTIWKGRGTTARWENKTAATYNFWIRSIDTSLNESLNATNTTLTINNPSTPTLSITLSGINAILKWTTSIGDFAIKEYEIRYGVDYASGTPVGIATTNVYTLRVDWGGARTFWVAARDISGNTGSSGGSTLTINNPNSVQNFDVTTIDNNVLLDWDDPIASSLPIDSYKVYKGATFGGASLIGTVKGTFHTYLEKTGGTFTYWIVTVDSAGNLSNEVSDTVTVNPPNDYVLRSSISFLNDVTKDLAIQERLKYARRNSGTVLALSHLSPTAYTDAGRNVVSSATLVSAWNDIQNSNNFVQSTDANKPLTSLSSNLENLLLDSGNCGTGNWNTAGLTSGSLVGITTPIGATANLLTESTFNVSHYVQSTNPKIGNGQKYRVSCYAKMYLNRGISILVDGNFTTSFIHAQLSTGTVTYTGGFSDVTLTPVFGFSGWYRISGLITANATGNGNVTILLLSGASTVTYTGDGISGAYVTGVQIQRDSADATYLATTTVPLYAGISSNSGLVFLPNKFLTSSLAVNPTGGMYGFIVITPFTQHLGVIYGAYGGTSRFELYINASGSIQLYIFKDGSNYIGRTTPNGSYVAGETFILSFTYDGGTLATGIAIFKNGTQIDNATSNLGTYTVPTAGQTLTIGARNAGASLFLNGIIYEQEFNQGSTITAADHKLEVARLFDKYLEPSSEALPDKIMLPLDLESWDTWWTEEGWSTWADAIAAYGGVYPTPNIKTGYAKWKVDYGAVLPASFVGFTWSRELIGNDITLTPTIRTSTDGISWTTYTGANEVYSTGFRYVEYILDFAASLGTELINLTAVTATVSLKTDDEQHIITCNSGDSYLGNPGTYLAFDKDFIAVTNINGTVLNTVPATCVVDFNNVPNPTYCLLLVFNTNTGARMTSSVSVNIKGAIDT